MCAIMGYAIMQDSLIMLHIVRLVMQRWRHAQEVLKEVEATLVMLLSKCKHIMLCNILL